MLSPPSDQEQDEMEVDEMEVARRHRPLHHHQHHHHHQQHIAVEEDIPLAASSSSASAASTRTSMLDEDGHSLDVAPSVAPSSSSAASADSPAVASNIAFQLNPKGVEEGAGTGTSLQLSGEDSSVPAALPQATTSSSSAAAAAAAGPDSPTQLTHPLPPLHNLPHIRQHSTPLLTNGEF